MWKWGDGPGGIFEAFLISANLSILASFALSLPCLQFDYTKDFFQKPAFLTVSGQRGVPAVRFCHAE